MGSTKKMRILYKLLNGRKKLLKILEKISFLIDNGLPVREAVESQFKVAEETGDYLSKELLKNINLSLVRGETISNGIKEFLSNEEYVLLSTAEKTGNLKVAINNILKIEKQKKNALKSLREGTIQPLLALVVALGVIYFLGAKVLPPIISFVGKGGLTGSARLLLYISDFVRSSLFPISIIALLFAGLVIFATFPYLKGRVRIFLDNYVPWRIYREYTGIMFLVSLSIMVDSGIPVIQSLKYMLPNSSPYLKEKVRSYIILMSKGESLGEALYKSGFNFPNKEVVYDLLVFSKYPKMQEKTFSLVQERFDDLGDNLKTIGNQISASLQILVYVLTILITLGSTSIVMKIQGKF